MNRLFVVSALIMTTIVLTACANTVRGVRRDVVSTGNAATGR